MSVAQLVNMFLSLLCVSWFCCGFISKCYGNICVSLLAWLFFICSWALMGATSILISRYWSETLTVESSLTFCCRCAFIATGTFLWNVLYCAPTQTRTQSRICNPCIINLTWVTPLYIIRKDLPLGPYGRKKDPLFHFSLCCLSEQVVHLSISPLHCNEKGRV